MFTGCSAVNVRSISRNKVIGGVGVAGRIGGRRGRVTCVEQAGGGVACVESKLSRMSMGFAAGCRVRFRGTHLSRLSIVFLFKTGEENGPFPGPLPAVPPELD